MGITSSTKELNTGTIPCGGTFEVTLGLTAAPDIVSNPTDIVLILDRSGSMSGKPLDNLKKGARKFIDIIDEATDSAQDGQIGNGSRIGIVSFATTATQDTQFITSVSALKDAVDGLNAGGSTNHADAFAKATALFDFASTNAKVMVMFTDGRTTAGVPPTPFADAAKAQGIIIYVIGLNGSGGIDEQALRDWASDPDSAYVSITPDDDELEQLFEDLAQNISKPGATDIVIKERVTDCFRILSFTKPDKGSAELLDERTLQWKIDKLGVSKSEGATLKFTVRHNGQCSGLLTVNEDIDYTDHEGNTVEFDDPKIEVDCGNDEFPEPCPTPVEVTIDGCEDAVEFDAGDLHLESIGRILQLDVTLKNICPRKRVALAVLLNEVYDKGHEFKRGFKTVVVPAHEHPTCRDVTVRCIKFVLPETLDASGDADSICNRRKLRARFIAHYIDYDFNCCTPR